MTKKNKPRIIHLDLFSGTGGFSLGLQQAGIEPTHHYFSEIDQYAIANYRHNFKNAQYLGTVTNVRHIIRTIDRKPTDRLIITFGSPCQDFSLAGRRAGLEGGKSSLIKFAIVLIKWLRPDVYIWENVKGAYSTNSGADFWGIIQAFANIDGYGLEQQLVNTAWLLPQNRERIYLVGHLTDRSQPGIFPFTENNTGIDQGLIKNNEKKSIEKSEVLKDLNSKKAPIKSNNKQGYEEASEGDSVNLKNPASKTRRGRVGKGVSPSLETNNQLGVIIQLNPSLESHNQQPFQQNRIYSQDGLLPSLSAYKSDLMIVASKGCKNLGDVKQDNETIEDGISNPSTGVQQDNLVITENFYKGRKKSEYDRVCPSLRSGRSGLEVSVKNQVIENGCEDDMCEPNDDGLFLIGDKRGDEGFRWRKNGNAPTILGSNQKSGTPNCSLLNTNGNIRRLTEIECERLQGFPDDWTKFGVYQTKNGLESKQIPKTQRYKLCGNAVTATIVKMIGQRIKFI